MNIAVLIKLVPVSNDVSVDPVTHALVRDSAESMINPADLNALEEAVALKEKTGGKVVVFTMAPPFADVLLRTAVSMGCDESCLITDRAFAGGDTVATAKVLAEGIKKHGEFDLILTGALSSDGATGQVGPMVAEFLSIPHIAEIFGIEDASEGSCEVVKKYAGSSYRIKTTLPALLSVTFGCNSPRLPTLRSQLAAKKKPMETYTNAEMNMKAEDVGIGGSPTAVVDSFAPEIAKKAVFLTGSTQEVTKQILELIEKEKGNI